MESGTKLGHYEISTLLGKGGMGEVWRARDTKLGREVAIKTLPQEFAKDADRLARFEREAKLLASLNHPNIAAIYGLEEHEGTRFLVLELVEGDTLADRLNRGAIPVEETLKLALQIADALKAAHDKGVIHRDLKPLNIKVTDDDTVKVLDFGLAKAFAGDEAEATVSNSPTLSMAATQQGLILGTAAYMSPEQAKGRTVDKRTDIWAFGCVLYEMLTGRQSFGASDVTESLAAVIRSEPQWGTLPTNLHPRLRETVERCLRKPVAKRYQDIGDVKVDLEQVLDDPGGVLVQPVAEAVEAKPQSKLPLVAVILLTAIVVGAAVWLLKPASEPDSVVRLAHVLPDGDAFTRENRHLLAVSPVGTRIVYVANNQLYLRNLGELEARPIQGTATNPSEPFFSPDEEWVGYWSFPDQLMKIPVGGGVAVSLTDTALGIGLRRASWGADDTIVYAQPEGIMRVSANGGTPDLLIAGPNLGAPQILPNDALLYSVGAQMEGEVTVQSLDSEEPKALFAGVFPTYVPTGHIVYQVDDVLFAVPFDVDSMEVTGGPVALLEGVRGGPPQYALSDSGSLVYVPGGAVGTDLVMALVDRDGAIETLDVPPQDYVAPRISPDGRRVAVGVMDEEGGSAIFIYDLAGNTAMRRLTQTLEGNNFGPLWTPDGECVTFTSDRDGTLGIYWQSADGTEVAEELFLAEEGTINLQPTSWSADGRTLAFHQNNAIWTLSLDDEAEPNPTLFFDVPDTNQVAAVFSPDGNWLAYYSYESGQGGVYVQPFPPTGRIATVTENSALEPLWSADGTELFYQLVPPTRIGAVDVTTAAGITFGVERLLPIENFLISRQFAGDNFRDYDQTPDSQQFVVTFRAVEAETGESIQRQINIVLNWFEELKERVPLP